MCLDPNNNEVDWYSVYKSPKIHASADWKVRAGLAHFYLDVHSPVWTLSGQPINSTEQQVAHTLQQIYKQKSNSLMYIMYNDEDPESKLKRGGGHTKGVVAFDETSGFWLIHSVPKFPPRQSKGYSWPHSALDYGQSFLCVSLPLQELNTVAIQLQFNQPDIYESNVPPQFYEKFPVLRQVIKETPPQGPPWSSVQKLTSIKNQVFVSFAKANKFHADLYDALVAPQLKASLKVETWLRRPGTPLASNCSAKYKVLKINEIKLPDDTDFMETKDHAKWAVTVPESQSLADTLAKDQSVVQMSSSSAEYACVGDINRMDSQFHRGGGTLCIQHSGVWKAFTNAIVSYQSCP
ncbi:deoxyribonuclease-2-alpha [Elysia marginata]|uniref:Deoxyribonuclease-2-alpha n=1 Tax=Elysia marginata TaxID=1093978 RepID=A0AAV4G7N2_9GAST|nr:deoxyribonuclease-2-alpha [Elysia marginata]